MESEASLGREEGGAAMMVEARKVMVARMESFMVDDVMLYCVVSLANSGMLCDKVELYIHRAVCLTSDKQRAGRIWGHKFYSVMTEPNLVILLATNLVWVKCPRHDRCRIMRHHSNPQPVCTACLISEDPLAM